MLRRLTRPILLLAVLLATAFLAGCATGLPGYGGFPGGGYGGQPDRGYGYGSERVVGTVEYLDPSSGRLVIVSDGAYNRAGSRVELAVDQNTRLFYQGREHSVAGLERGDRISADVTSDGRRLWARTIEVIQNIRDTGAYGGQYGGNPYGGSYGDPYGGSYGGALEGAVRYVDPGRRLIEITRGGSSGSVERVYYDAGTQFSYRGQFVRPEQLEPGDIVRIDARRSGQNWIARSVTVTVNARAR